MTRRVVVVAPGRPSLGERRRTETWHRLIEADGAAATTVATSTVGGRLTPSPGDVGHLANGRLVPEALAWSVDAVRAEIDAVGPDLVILQTARSAHPGLLTGAWPVVVDLVDRLSASYRQRAALARGPAAPLFRALAGAHARTEARLLAGSSAAGVPVVLAGHGEATRSGARWVPNLLDVSTAAPDRRREAPPFDLVFFGTLGYRPNIEALTELDAGDPGAAGLRVLVAGQRPPSVVADLCRARGWTLVADFPSMSWLAEQAAVAVAPLRSTAGIQNKVLEAALIGLPQVVTPAALDGLAPGLPCRVTDDGAALVRAAAELVADPSAAARLADEARHHVVAQYTVGRWRTTIESLSTGRWPVPV